MAKTDAERTAKVREERKRKGLRRVEFWVTPEEKLYLKLQLDMLRAQSGK